ncbi:hypothetical protein [Streptomyces sp. NRRL S-920]|uniref:hypothetical protein n=1 Tax=Streptomyces sp. NRRL S-920 TaxID=1463921 RepID=UPI00131DB359|nr:hypothetical protein [Streptomyces sp. NRRL S-920]
MSLATLAACTDSESSDPTEPPTRTVQFSVKTPHDFVKGRPGDVLLEVENNGPYQKEVEIDLSFDLKQVPQGAISAEYEDPASDAWKDIRLSRKGGAGRTSLSGTFHAPLPKGHNILRIRLTPGARPTAAGQSIGIAATLRGAKKELATSTGKAELANLDVEVESHAEYVRRQGGWSEYSFTVNNTSEVKYPKIQALAFLCKEVEHDCRQDQSTSALHVQWRDGRKWKDLDTSTPTSSTEPGSSYFDDAAILSTSMPLPAAASQSLRFRIKAADPPGGDEWQGGLNLVARHKGGDSTTEFSSKTAIFRIK